jgi:hypothetical protein
MHISRTIAPALIMCGRVILAHVQRCAHCLPGLLHRCQRCTPRRGAIDASDGRRSARGCGRKERSRVRSQVWSSSGAVACEGACFSKTERAVHQKSWSCRMRARTFHGHASAGRCTLAEGGPAEDVGETVTVTVTATATAQMAVVKGGRQQRSGCRETQRGVNYFGVWFLVTSPGPFPCHKAETTARSRR